MLKEPTSKEQGNLMKQNFYKRNDVRLFYLCYILFRISCSNICKFMYFLLPLHELTGHGKRKF